MNTFPLLKTKLSNERLMSALLLVLLLYNLPRFLSQPVSIPPLVLLLVIALVLDAGVHFYLYKRPVCAVSASVTALILYTLSPGAPFWAECAALGAALVAGKAIWGGTGKNPLNPAMIGLAFMALLTPLPSPAFEPSLFLLPAVLLSLPFLLIRPYAGLGMLVGMTAALLFTHSLTVGSMISSGVFFWGCLVITDPVTTTSKPAAGFVIGLLAGFVPGAAGFSAGIMPIVILVSNLLSYLADWLSIGKSEKLEKAFGRKQKIKLSAGVTAFTDLTEAHTEERADMSISCEEILRRIEKNGVFGFGGAAFPTIQKIRTVMASASSDKYFIINAVECDPGLVHDKWLLKNHPEEIMKGIDIIRQCIPFKSVTVAAKDFDGVPFPAPVQSHRVSDFYPAGAEKLLVRDVLNIMLSDIPAVSGILVLNVQTVYAINDAILSDRKADTRLLTVADLDKGIGRVVRVKLGAGVRKTAETVLPNALNIYTGGGMMSARLSDDDAVIDEKTNFLAVGQIKAFREAVCSQCNFCSAYCPVSLPVREIAHFVDADRLDKAARLHPENCMECALCSTVCLAGRDQARRVRAAKKSVANARALC